MSVEDNKQCGDGNNRFVPMSVGELYAIEHPEGSWIVEGFIPAGGITILSGAPSTFKTMLCMEIAKCISSGSAFLGKMRCQQQGVLMIDEENSDGIVQRRFRQLEIPEKLPIRLLLQRGFVVNADAIGKILDVCKKNNIGVVFIDSFVRVSDAMENESTSVARVFRDIKKLCQAGITVVIIHHEKKEQLFGGRSASSRLRGSSDILAVADAHISLRREKTNGKDIVLVEHNKLRIAKELEPFNIEVTSNEDEIRFSYAGSGPAKTKKKADEAKEIVLDVIKKAKQGGLLKGEICKQVKRRADIGEKNVKEAIDTLVQEKVISVKNGDKNKKICFLNVTE